MLEILDISSNNFSGEIPSDTDHMIPLQFVNIAYNQFGRRHWRGTPGRLSEIQDSAQHPQKAATAEVTRKHVEHIQECVSGGNVVEAGAEVERVFSEAVVVAVRQIPDESTFAGRRTLIGQEDNLEQRKKPITVAFLNLSKPQIEKLRSKANLDIDNSCRGYSRFESVAAHIWRCTSKARRHAAEQQTSVHFVADFRNKLNPPLPKNYFGNALIRVEATDKSGSLLSNPIAAASRKIREAGEKVSDDSVRGYLDYLKNLPEVDRFRSLDNNGRPKGDFYGNPNLAIISWTALPLYGTDFGWGKEINMGPGSMGFDGKTFIIPGRGGDGSFNVAIWLQEEYMGEFKKCFYDDI